MTQEYSGEYVHDGCPGSWCTTVACSECGEMLTNPTVKDDVLVGICMSHGRKAPGVVMRRADCAVYFGSNKPLTS